MHFSNPMAFLQTSKSPTFPRPSFSSKPHNMTNSAAHLARPTTVVFKSSSFQLQQLLPLFVYSRKRPLPCLHLTIRRPRQILVRRTTNRTAIPYAQTHLITAASALHRPGRLYRTSAPNVIHNDRHSSILLPFHFSNPGLMTSWPAGAPILPFVLAQAHNAFLTIVVRPSSRPSNPG